MLKNPEGEKLLPSVIRKNIPIIVERGILFILLAVTSDILTFININMNKNKKANIFVDKNIILKYNK